VKLSLIAKTLGTNLPEGIVDREVDGIASPQSADEHQVTFCAKADFVSAVKASRCAAVIVRRGERIPGKVCIETDDPYVGYAKVARSFEDVRPLWGEGIARSAIVDPTARICSGTSLGPFAVVGANVSIGERSRIGAHCIVEKDVSIGADCRLDSGTVVRYGTKVGNRVIIQSGTVIGSDGFGNARENKKFIRIPCFGNVVIEDDVDIGACCTIDRGNFESTLIRRGAKLDNLVHVAHNVVIGEDSAIAAQTGISGSTMIGNRVLIGGQAGFVGHLEIGDDSFVGAKAGVSKDVKAGENITGYPARDIMTLRRIEAAGTRLPALLKEVKQLRKDIEALKGKE
jgi:UDP-3-O-[3-hydroxymyristoyl] glucosamine N-acyltransferase